MNKEQKKLPVPYLKGEKIFKKCQGIQKSNETQCLSDLIEDWEDLAVKEK